MNKEPLIKLAKLFQVNDSTLFQVGGFVRDELLNKSSYDLDLAGDLQPNVVKDICSNGFNIKTESQKFGTLIISCKNFSAEYTTFRSEEYLSTVDHSPHKIFFETSIERDAFRRDFTINCIYKNVLTGEIIDPYNGVKDLKNKVIKQLHKNVFDVDPLRILRMVRFASELGFRIDSQTFETATNNVYKIKYLSKERITTEFNKIIAGKYALNGIKLLMKLGILKECKLNNFKLDNSLIALCGDLFYDNIDDMDGFLDLYAPDKKTKEKITKAIQFAKSFDTYKNIQTLINNEPYLFDACCVLKEKGAFIKVLDDLIKRKLPLSIDQLDINGFDLIELGIQNIKIGECLEYLLMKVVRDKVPNNKDILISKIKERNK